MNGPGPFVAIDLARRIVPILVGYTIALASMAVPLALVNHVDLGQYPDLAFVCREVHADVARCTGGAAEVASTMLIGLLIAGLGAIALIVVTARASSADRRTADVATIIISVAAGAICGIHVLREALTMPLSRVDPLASYGLLISLENLLWPLLLQLFASAVDVRARGCAGAAALLLAALSPFRGVIFAVAIFLPFAIAIEVLWSTRGKRASVYIGAVAILIVGALSFLVFVQTEGRFSNTTSRNEVVRALTQRAMMPLFQAFATEHAARTEPLPTALDNVLIKLRLKQGRNLNQSLYRVLHSPGSSIGETTPLLYGEAKANEVRPVVWIFMGTMIVIFAAVGLAWFGLEAFMLAAIAIWRGSLGGISDVLAGFAIQIVILTAAIFAFKGIRLKRFASILTAGLLIAVSSANLFAHWRASELSQVIAQFRFAPPAISVLTGCGPLQPIIEQATEPFVGSGVTRASADMFEATLTVNAAVRTASPPLAMDVANSVADHLAKRCGVDRAAIDLTSAYRGARGRISPLDALAFLATWAALLLSLVAMNWRKDVMRAEL
jgi:hypothetical protein